jgi:hypothetical protein
MVRFSLQTLLLMMALVAAYTAGWISHREWNRRHLAESISKAMKAAADAPVQIEYVEGTDVLMTRGRKEDVERMTTIVSDIEEAARQ